MFVDRQVNLFHNGKLPVEAPAPFGGYADAPTAGEETPEETLTTQL